MTNPTPDTVNPVPEPNADPSLPPNTDQSSAPEEEPKAETQTPEAPAETPQAMAASAEPEKPKEEQAKPAEPAPPSQPAMPVQPAPAARTEDSREAPAAAPRRALDESDEGEDFEAPLSAQAAVQLLEKEMAEGKRAEPAPMPSKLEIKQGQGLLFFGQLLIAGALVFVGLSFNKKAPEKEYSPAPPSILDAGPSVEDAQAAASGQLTPFGPGKALYSDGQGRFLIMVLNPASGELVVEKALELVYDPTRLHQSDLRKDHHYYFEDIVQSRKALLKSLRDEFTRLASSGRTDSLTLERLLNLARRIGRFHDVTYLLPYLKHERFFVRQAAALGLGEQGYRIALEELIFSMDTGDVEFRKHLRQTLKDLTGVDFLTKPEDPKQTKAMETARKWLRRHPQKSPYAVGHALREKQEGRINRGL